MGNTLKSELYIGIMSGTSLDGIDTTLVDFTHDTPIVVATYFSPYTAKLRETLLSLHSPTNNELHQTQLVANDLSERYAEAVKQLLDRAGVNAHEVCAIGCHGQTIRHCPEHAYTIQLCNAALLAELSGISVVNDFRSRDIAAGGQGAPLVPAFHHHVLRHPRTHRVIINIGGISNITNLAPGIPTTGFDCGPGNLLMDAWMFNHHAQTYDKDGQWAASGNEIPDLLTQLLSDPYFNVTPPKSCGRDLFNMKWLTDKLNGNEAPADVQASLLALTALTIRDAVLKYCMGAQEIYLCGGGSHNSALLIRLRDELPQCSINLTDQLGIDADWMEAIAFAWLSKQTMHGLTANLPEATGARHACILGAIHQA